MKRTSLVVLILLSFLSFGFQSGRSEGAQAPKMVMEEKEFSFGEVKQGARLSHVFLLKNEGGAPLEINDVRTG